MALLYSPAETYVDAMSGKKGKSGRKPKLTEELIAKAKPYAEAGLTDAEIAEKFGVSRDVLQNWKDQFPHFYHTLTVCKQTPDERVKVSLFLRACGYSHPMEEIKVLQNGEVVRVQTVKHYPPDPTSMIFWLKNRQPQDWRDKTEVELSTVDAKLIDLAKKRNKD